MNKNHIMNSRDLDDRLRLGGFRYYQGYWLHGNYRLHFRTIEVADPSRAPLLAAIPWAAEIMEELLV